MWIRCHCFVISLRDKDTKYSMIYGIKQVTMMDGVFPPSRSPVCLLCSPPSDFLGQKGRHHTLQPCSLHLVWKLRIFLKMVPIRFQSDWYKNYKQCTIWSLIKADRSILHNWSLLHWLAFGESQGLATSRTQSQLHPKSATIHSG